MSEFVETKCLELRANTYRNAIDAYLTGADPGKFNGHLKTFDDGVIPHYADTEASN